MKIAAWMAGASVASAALATIVFGVERGGVIVAGMLGPLVAAVTSWLLVARTFVRRPDQVTALMMGAFAAKLVFFGAYVAVAIVGLRLPAVPFAVSFTGYFIGLYLAEALCLHRLFAGSMRPPIERS